MIPAARPRNPILPGDAGDRTGTAGIRRRAVAVIRRRFDGLRRELLAIFGRVRVYQPNDEGDEDERTVYGATGPELAALSQDIQLEVDRWIASDGDAASTGWWDRFEEEAAILGAALVFANLARLSDAYAATRTLQHVIQSPAFRERLAAAQFSSREHWLGLASTLRADTAQIIGRAIAAGKSPRQVRAEIAERVEVIKARALQFARDTIADTVRAVRLAEMEFARAQLGLQMALLWASAFKATTRAWHASRHGRAYSPADVRLFYSQGGNRFNCYCRTTECMVDGDGKPVLTASLKKAMAREKANWRSETAAV